jgi:very-short-patch-repair endonuclease
MFSDVVHLVETLLAALPPSWYIMGALLIVLVVIRWLWPRRRVQRGNWYKRRAPWISPRNGPIPMQESAIEEAFRLAWLRAHPQIPLIPQYPIGPYHVDFAHVASQVVVELDGFVAHSSTYQIERDCRRQREIMRRGWHVFRFGGREVYHETQRCIQETHAFILQQQQAARR